MFQFHDLGVEGFTFRFGHGSQFAAGLQHFLNPLAFRIGLLQVLRGLGRGLKLRIFLRKLDEDVAGRARGKLVLDTGKPVDDPVKLFNLDCTHGGACSGSCTPSPRPEAADWQSARISALGLAG